MKWCFAPVWILSFALLVPAGGQPRTAQPVPAEKSAPEHAWDDLRWLLTAFEAYGIDNDGLYATAGAKREGAVAELDEVLGWYYENTFPKRTAPPHVDPWGRPYRFVISSERRSYALYSLGPEGKLGEAEAAFLQRVKDDRLSEKDRKARRISRALIVANGAILFAPPEVPSSGN